MHQREGPPPTQPHAKRPKGQQARADAGDLHDAISELGLLRRGCRRNPVAQQQFPGKVLAATVTPQKVPSPTAANNIPSSARRRHRGSPNRSRNRPICGPVEAAARAPGGSPAFGFLHAGHHPEHQHAGTTEIR